MSLTGSHDNARASAITNPSKNIYYTDFNLNVDRCTNTTHGICSTDAEIDNWLGGKLFDVRVINSKAVLSPPKEFSLK